MSRRFTISARTCCLEWSLSRIANAGPGKFCRRVLIDPRTSGDPEDMVNKRMFGSDLVFSEMREAVMSTETTTYGRPICRITDEKNRADPPCHVPNSMTTDGCNETRISW